jgi:putative lipoic acid-binding regulatory protein
MSAEQVSATAPKRHDDGMNSTSTEQRYASISLKVVLENRKQYHCMTREVDSKHFPASMYY